MQYNIYEAKAKLSELVAAAARGEQVILSRNGKPMARLVPYNDAPASAVWSGRGFGLDAGILDVPAEFDAPLPDEVLASFEQ